MHNPILTISVATYVTLLHLGMIVVALILPKVTTSPDVRAGRMRAGVFAYIVGLVAAIAYAVKQQARMQTHITYWATILTLLFGLSLCVYMAIPKQIHLNPTQADQTIRQSWQVGSAVVSGVALFGSLTAGAVAWHKMRPIV